MHTKRRIPRERVFADFNAVDGDFVRLTTRGSVESLKQYPYLREGHKVLLYDGDIEVRAELVCGEKEGTFFAKADWTTQEDVEQEDDVSSNHTPIKPADLLFVADVPVEKWEKLAQDLWLLLEDIEKTSSLMQPSSLEEYKAFHNYALNKARQRQYKMLARMEKNRE